MSHTINAAQQRQPNAFSTAYLQSLWQSNQNRLLTRLSAGHVVSDLCAGFMLPILPILARTLDFNLSEAGALIMVSSITSSVLQPLLGLFSERFSRLNYILIGLLIAIICIAGIGLSPNFWTLATLIGVGYLGVGLMHPRAITYAHSLGSAGNNGVKGNENMMMSIFIAAGTSGFAFGPLLSGWLVENWGLRATVGLAVLVIPMVFLFTGIDKRFLKTLARPKQQQKKREGLSRQHIKIIALLSSIGIARATMMVGLDSFMPFVWDAAGYPLMLTGTIMGVSALTGGGLSLYAGHLADKHSEKPIMELSFYPCLILIPLLLYVSWEPTLIAHYSWLSYSLFIIVHTVLIFSLAANLILALRAVKGHRGLVSGVIAGFSFGIAGLLMTLIGIIGEHWGLIVALSTLMLPLLYGSIAIRLIPHTLYKNTPNPVS